MPSPVATASAFRQMSRFAARGRAVLRLADEHVAGVEQRELQRLDVLLRLRPWLRGDDADITTGGRRMAESMAQQSRLHAAAALRDVASNPGAVVELS